MTVLHDWIGEKGQALPGPVLLGDNEPVASQCSLHSKAALLQTLQVACKQSKLSARSSPSGKCVHT